MRKQTNFLRHFLFIVLSFFALLSFSYVYATGGSFSVNTSGLTSTASVVITVSGTDAYNGGSVSGSTTVNVIPYTVPTYTVTCNAGSNGTCTTSPQPVASGGTATFTVTPSFGYAASATGCGGTLSGTTYTTGPISAACTVNATFSNVTHTVTDSIDTASVGHGTISPSGAHTVAGGSQDIITLSPATGYTSGISSSTTCTGTLSGNTYTISSVTADCNVIATFSNITVTISASPAGPLTDPATTTLTWTTTGNPTSCDATGSEWTGTNITSGQGVAIRSGMTATNSTTPKSYVFSIACHKTGVADATGSVTVVVNPAGTTTYTVTGTAGANGTISPSTRTVASGGTTTFTVTPNSGYTASATDNCGTNGTSNGALVGTTYTTGAITASCTVTASFAAVTSGCSGSAPSCTSSPNTCGMTNTGVESCVSNKWTCSASAPSNSSCIIPSGPVDLAAVDFHLTDSNGNTKTTFAPGENIYPSFTYQNIGSSPVTVANPSDSFFGNAIYSSLSSPPTFARYGAGMSNDIMQISSINPGVLVTTNYLSPSGYNPSYSNAWGGGMPAYFTQSTPGVYTAYAQADAFNSLGTGSNDSNLTNNILSTTYTIAPQITASLTFTPNSTCTGTTPCVYTGESGTLQWSSTGGATSCTGTNFSTGGATSGSLSVTPLSTVTYSVSCSAASGSPVTSQVIVTVKHKPAIIEN